MKIFGVRNDEVRTSHRHLPHNSVSVFITVNKILNSSFGINKTAAVASAGSHCRCYCCFSLYDYPNMPKSVTLSFTTSTMNV